MSKGKKYTISFAGDTSLGEWYLRKSGREELINRLENNPSSFFDGTKPLIEKSDYFILSLTTVLGDSPKSVLERKQYPNYDHPDRTIKVLKDLGVSAVGLANNHTMDFGEKGLLKTIKRLKKEKIDSFGAGKNKDRASTPHKITLKGKKKNKNIYIFTGMISNKRYREHDFFAKNKKVGINSLPQKSLSRQISRLRKKDPESIIIIYPYWQGYDYKKVSNNSRIRERCRTFIDAGANYIFGHGTHMIDNIEYYNGGTIAYSIGNFVFNSPGKYSAMQAPPYSLIINMEINENVNGKWNIQNRFYPIVTDNKITNFSVKPFNTKKNAFFELIDSNNKGNIKYDILTELGIKSKSIKDIKKIKKFSVHKLLAKEFEAHGIKTEYIDRYLVAYIDEETIIFRESRPSTDSHISSKIVKDKGVTRIFLKEKGISVAKGKVFNQKQKTEAWEFTKKLNSAVIKPLSGNKGKGVTTGITNKNEFLRAWENSIKISRGKILIEEQFMNGQEFRYLVIGGKYTACHIRIPPRVIGNGIDTIEDLIQKKNNERSLNPYLAFKLIKIDEQRKNSIKKQGYHLNDVLEKDKELIIDSKGGLSTGGDSVDMTDKVHESFKRIAEKAATALPGLDVVGVDILAENHFKPANTENYIIVEVNTMPGLGGHIHPSYGEPRNVTKDIVDYIIKKVQRGNIE